MKSSTVKKGFAHFAIALAQEQSATNGGGDYIFDHVFFDIFFFQRKKYENAFVKLKLKLGTDL